MKPRTFKAIVTKFIACTNSKPARVKATAGEGLSVVLPWYTDACDNFEDRHDAAALALATKYGWAGHWFKGGMPDGKGNVYVCADQVAGAALAAFVTTSSK